MPRPRALARRSTELVALILALVLLPLTAVAMPVEGYAPYQPQRNCNPTAKPGTLELARWLQRRYPGTGSLGISRACGHGGVSEHKEGRAFDWGVSATSKRDRAYVQDFLARVLATDKHGNDAALARRMGIMYILWNDHSWASYRGFAKADYRHSACRPRKKCSATLRHRDHVHISLSRAGARGDTSWYHRHDPQPPAPAPTAPTPTPDPVPAPDEPPVEAVPARVLDFTERPYARFAVPADGTPVRAKLALAAGTTYKVTASGLVTYGRPHQVADASCVWTPDGWTARPPQATRRTHGSLNLTVNGRAVLDPECRKGHTYTATVTPRRKTSLTLRLVNGGPAPDVPGGRITVVVSKVRTKVADALPERSPLSPAPSADPEAARGYGLLTESVAVRADRGTVRTRQELQEGARYRITVTGVASLGNGVHTDGRCVELGGAWFGSAPLDRRHPDQDHGDLYVDGSPFRGRSQGAGCEAHHYVATHVATRTGRLTLGLWDPLDRSDNSGAVTVQVQRLTELPTTPTAGTASRPKKKAKAWRQGREWFEVPVDRAVGVQSTLRFRKGERVLVVVRGTVRSHGVQADAACVSTPGGWLRTDPAVAVRQDPLELWVDGKPARWRAIGPTSPCSDEHSYTVRHTAAKSGRLRLALLDLDHRDNTGSLRVTLLRQR